MPVRNKKSFWKKIIGPGVITGASDDDPSGILTYLQTGTVMGLKGLWMALLTMPLMYAVQEMCGRIGMVTGKGLMRLIKERYAPVFVYFIAFVSITVMVINIGADLLAIGVVGEHIFGGPRLFWLLLVAFLIVLGVIFFSYHRFAGILKWLSLSLFFYVVSVFFMRIDWGPVFLNTFWPRIGFDKTTLMLIVAVIGTTITPYMFFWQTSEEMEERNEDSEAAPAKRYLVTRHRLSLLGEDTFLGMLFSNVVMWFIIVGASQLREIYGVTEISNFDQAALVLKPLLGDFAFFIFGLGIIGTGLLAVPILSGSVGYIFSEIFNWPEGINKKFLQAKGFYLVIATATLFGAALSLMGFDPVKMLIYTAVFYAIITPFLIFVIIRMANDRKLMKNKVNSKVFNFLGWLTLVVCLVAVIGYFFA